MRMSIPLILPAKEASQRKSNSRTLYSRQKNRSTIFPGFLTSYSIILHIFSFVLALPNQKWLTDVTEFPLHGQKPYLSPILDLHNGYLVSDTISERPVLSMVTAMPEKSFETIPDGLIRFSTVTQAGNTSGFAGRRVSDKA